MVKDSRPAETSTSLLRKFLSDKIIKFYEDLSAHVQAVDPQFPLDQVKVMSDFLRWKKRQSERNPPPPAAEDELG